MHLEETQISSKHVFGGKVVDLRVDTVELENGTCAIREVITHSGGACVVPVDSDGNIIMVKQFRYPFGEILTEIPAGKLEKDEDPYKAAMRELEEETGTVSEKVTPLGVCYPTVAYDTEKIYMYLCEDLKKTHVHPDEDEFLDIVKIPFEKAVEMIMNGEIPDAKTQIAILKAAKILEGKEK